MGLDNEDLGAGKVFTKFFPDSKHPGRLERLARSRRRGCLREKSFSRLAQPVTALSTAPGATSLYVVGLDKRGTWGRKSVHEFFPDSKHPGDWNDWLVLEDRDVSVRRVFPVGATNPCSEHRAWCDEPVCCGLG